MMREPMTHPMRDSGGKRAAAFAALLSFAPFAAEAAAPPLPGSTGVGSLPSTRANAARSAAEASGTPLATDTAPQIRLGNFGFPITGVPADSLEPGRAFTITPSIGVQALATDNVFNRSNNKSADVITTVSPGLLLSADTARLQGVLSYTPNLQFYADNSDQNRIDHNFNGAALVSVVPGLLYLDVRGNSSVRDIRGGNAPQSNLVTNDGDQVQTTSFQISPYIVQRFGDIATLQVGYAYQYVDDGGDDRRIGTVVGQQPGVQTGRAGQSFTANRGYAVVRTGPAFGRFAAEGTVEATEYDGDGVLQGAYRRLAFLEGRYAVLRGVNVLLGGGYEQQRFGGNPGIDISEPVWSVGVQFDLRDRGQVTVRYGRRNGFNSASVDGYVQIAPRTRISASYREDLSTSSLQDADLLSTTTLDEYGNPIDLATGLPRQRGFSGGFLGAQNSLSRIKTATLAAVQTWPRDTVALTLTREEQEPVSVASDGSSYSQKGTSAGLTWAHALTPRMNLLSYIQYGETESNLFGDGRVYSASATVTRDLGPQLTGLLQIGTRTREDSGVNGRATQNYILIGLRKTF